jgi:hypothetical protein
VAPTARGGGIQITYNHVYGTEGECPMRTPMQFPISMFATAGYKLSYTVAVGSIYRNPYVPS